MNRPGHSLLSRLSFSRPQKRETKAEQYQLSTNTILAMLEQLRGGYLTLILPNNELRTFGNSAESLHAELHINDWSVFKQVLSHGDIGFAESYIRGQWNTSDLKSLLELAIHNRSIL